MDIQEKIKSIRETIGVDFVRPDPKKLESFIDNLSRHPQAMEYLTNKRGLTEETIKHFELGYDPIRDAIAIPIFKKGELINIKYRYLNNPEQRYSGEAGAEMWIFNEDGIDKSEGQAVLVVEGEFDCMSAWQEGVKRVVSPSGGKDSYGLWIALFDNIKRVYIAYDNDDPGKQAAFKMAERIGIDKCFDVVWEGAKDANEWILANPGKVVPLIKNAKPFTSRQFKSLGDIIEKLRKGERTDIVSSFIPKVNFKNGWMAVISGKSNVGKTSYVLNIADELSANGIPVLVFPFERGIESVGERYLQLLARSGPDEMSNFTPEQWDDLSMKAIDRPIYFALPDKNSTIDFMVKAKRFFDTKVVIVDHLDYMVRQVGSSRGDAIMDTLQQLKRAAEENGIVLLVVSHIRKIEAPGAVIDRSRRPNLEDLKGSSSLYQDPEVVVMLSDTEMEDEIYVEVLKNKGEMKSAVFQFHRGPGVFEKKQTADELFENFGKNAF